MKIKLQALSPLFVIILSAIIIYSLRFMAELNEYALNLTYAHPIINIILVLIAFHKVIRKDKATLADLGLTPDKIKLTLSLILGIIGGLFFFLAYFGAHPNRLFPPFKIFIFFNIYFLFFTISNEIIYRGWIIYSFQQGFSRIQSILLSALAYTIASVAVIGQDLSSVVAGQIDLFIIIEVALLSIIVGVILAIIFSFTKSIYGNIFFVIISTIPSLYDEVGPVLKGNFISAMLSLVFLFILLVLIVHYYRKNLKSLQLDSPA